MTGPLPDNVQQFIARYIDSVEKLEVMLLFSTHPERALSAEEVFQQIQSSHNSVNRRLRELQSEGIIEIDPQTQKYRFHTRSREMTDLVNAVTTAYRERRIKVIESIFSRSEEQIRKFSDAFKFRKDEE